jgi:hypothetical protein
MLRRTINSTSPSRPSGFAILGLIALTAATLPFAGCKKNVDDSTLNNNVQTAIKGDPTIAQQPVQVAVQQGVVTLSGNVSDDTASAVAAKDAATVKGVKEVVNNLTVAGIQVTPTVTSPEAPDNPRPATAAEQQTIAAQKTLPPPPNDEPAPPPPPPAFQDVTVPAGRNLSVRITQAMDSGHTQTGASFNGVLTRDVVVNGLSVLHGGSAVSGTVVNAKDAGHYKGNSILSVALTSVRRHGVLIAISTDPYTLEGKGRGKNTAVKIGGGAAAGAVLGGIFGGGKGAAIGTLAGAGAGTAYQGVTRGEQVSIPSESVVVFRLARPFTVKVPTSDTGTESPASDQAPPPDQSAPAPTLQTH